MLIQALDRAPPDGVSFTHLVQPGPGPDGLRRDGTRLVAEDPDLLRFLKRAGLAPVLDLAACDALVIVGMTLGVRFPALLMRGHSMMGWPSAHDIPAQLDTRKRPADMPLISHAAVTAALLDRFERMALHRLLTQIREASDLPVFLVQQPHPSVEALDGKGEGTASLRQLHARGDSAALADLLDAALDRYVAQFADVTLVPRPAETVREGFLTDAALMRGSQRLLGEDAHEDHDLFHANVEYGHLQIAVLLASLGRTRPL